MPGLNLPNAVCVCNKGGAYVGSLIGPCGSGSSPSWWKEHWAKSQEALAGVQSAMNNNRTLGKSSIFPIDGNKATLSSQDYD